MKNEKQINFHGINTVAINFKGVQIVYNSLNGHWMLFFKKDGKFSDQPPFAGTLTEMKSIVTGAIKKKMGGELELLQADTY